MRTARGRAIIACLPAVLVAAGLLVGSFPSGLIAVKVIGLLCMPSGLVWLGLLTLCACPVPNKPMRALLIATTITYTLAGNAWFGGWLLTRLETPYAHLRTPQEPFDAICVLGGGSSARPDGQPQLGPAGDRLAAPARMFLTGKAAHLVASGLNVTDIGGTRSIARDTAAIWRDWGVPEHAIILLEQPRNTREEILAYKALIREKGWQRVGVCSSAWHLPRVERICRSTGVVMTPVPADFLSSPLPWSPIYAIPQARGFQNVQKALWEFLGAATGG